MMTNEARSKIVAAVVRYNSGFNLTGPRAHRSRRKNSTRLFLSVLLILSGCAEAVLAGLGFICNARNTGDPVTAGVGLLAITLCAGITAVALADLWKPEAASK